MGRQEMAMCRSCGHFLAVLKEQGAWEPIKDECPECGGTEFKKNDTGEVFETGQ